MKLGIFEGAEERECDGDKSKERGRSGRWREKRENLENLREFEGKREVNVGLVR